MNFGGGATFLSPLSLGLTSMISQILLLREMVVAAYGNELSLGAMLSAWLLWVGIGSFLANLITRRFPTEAEGKALSGAYGLLGLSIPLSLLLIRSARPLLGIGPGEVMPLTSILFLSFLLSLPPCLLLGLLFVLNARFFGRALDGAREGISFVYLWEAMGAFLGGISSTYLLIPRLSNLQISLLLLLLNLLISLSLLRWPKRRVILGMGTSLLLFSFLFLLHIPSLLDLLSWKWHWRGLSLLETSDTIYGNIAVGERWGQIDLFENGLRLFSYPDLATAEEAVHYALLQHPDPRSLFLLGGGVGGGLAQALKYPKLSVDYAELDPQLIHLAARHAPQEANALQDPRVRVLYGDGRLLLRESGRHYDVIVLNLPDPYTLQLNRFYTREFFRIVRDHLAPGGLLSFRLSSSENYLSPDLAKYLGLMQNSLRAVFPEVVTFPGETCIFFASREKGLLLGEARGLVERLRERHLENRYVNEFLIPFRLHPFKMRYLRERLRGQDTRINQDLAPISYFYQATLWASQFGAWERRVFSSLARLPWGAALLFLFLPFALLLFWQAVTLSLASGSLLGSVLVTGMTSISLEVISLLAFQIFYGFIYQKMGFLLAAFMFGLSIGAFWGRKKGISRKWLLASQATLAGFCLLFFSALRESLPVLAPSGWIEILFFLFLMGAGAVGGLQFCLANALFIEVRPKGGWGTAYAVDLWGSALGALLFSALFIPLWGIPWSLLSLCLLNLVAFAFLLLSVKR